MSGFPLDVPIRIGGEAARREALRELGKAKYGGTPAWVDSAADWVSRQLGRVIDALLGLSNRSSGGGVNPGFVVAVVLLVAAVGVVVWRVGLPRWRRTAAEQALQLDPTRTAQDYRAAAEAAAARGEWAPAVRDRFRSLVRGLEVRTVLDVRPARTASEAAYSASRVLVEQTADLRWAAETFNAVVYGDRPADAAAYAGMSTVDDRVTRAADEADLAADPAPDAAGVR